MSWPWPKAMVETLAWDEARAIWRATLRGRDGRTEVVEANAVVTAVARGDLEQTMELEDGGQGPRRGG